MAKKLDVRSHTAHVGTCCYMAPEVIQTGKYSFSADIYSLAITVWELCCRQQPYYHLQHILPFDLLNRIVGGERPLIENFVDETVVAFLKRAWTATPEERPAVAEFLTFAETPDVQIKWNINGQCLDNATSSDIRPKQMAEVLQVKLNLTPQQTSDPEVPLIIGGRDHLFIGILNVEANTWKRLAPPVLHAAWDHGSAYLNGEIYLIGGYPEEESKSVYKLEKTEWTKMPDMIEGRRGISNSTVVFEGCIWVIGGRTDPGHYLTTVEVYDPESNSWSQKTEMNTARYYAAAAVLKGKIFVCGGWNGKEPLNSVEYFDPLRSKWIFCTPMPAPRFGLVVVAQGGFLTLMGGRDGDKTADVWRMNVDDSRPKWSVLASMKKPRSAFTALVYYGRIIVAGGCEMNGSSQSSVESFDGKEWTERPALKSGTNCMAATLVPQKFARMLLATYPPL